MEDRKYKVTISHRRLPNKSFEPDVVFDNLMAKPGIQTLSSAMVMVRVHNGLTVYYSSMDIATITVESEECDPEAAARTILESVMSRLQAGVAQGKVKASKTPFDDEDNDA